MHRLKTKPAVRNQETHRQVQGSEKEQCKPKGQKTSKRPRQPIKKHHHDELHQSPCCFREEGSSISVGDTTTRGCADGSQGSMLKEWSQMTEALCLESC